MKKQDDSIKTQKIKIDSNNKKARMGLRILYEGIIIDNIVGLEIEYIKDSRIPESNQLNKLLGDINDE